MSEKIDYFGCITQPWEVHLPELDIVPDQPFDVFLRSLSEQVNDDGFLYPPTAYTAYMVNGVEAKPIPNSRRPAPMWQIPVSHKIIHKMQTQKESRLGLSGFVVFLFGFLAGQSAQFFDWKVVGRIPIKAHYKLCFRDADCQKYINTALDTWRALDPDGQKRLTNILYCRGRLFAYESLWEKFIFNYMLVDSIWRFLPHKQKKIGHRDRLATMCNELSLHVDTDALGKIVALRNDLFHESLWAKDMPGYSSNGIQEAVCLHNIVEQLIVRCLGFTAELPPWTLKVDYALD